MRSVKQIVGLGALLARTVLSNPFDSIVNGRPIGSSFGIPGNDATYDYVVVGGGAGGLTIASRLAEQGAGSVAIVEAGTFYELSNGNQSQIPANANLYNGKSADDWQPYADWGYMTTPQEFANGESIHYARGRMFGGCTARNYMLYHRATADSYDIWADQVGDESYTLDNWLPYFEKSLNFTPPNNELRMQNSTPGYDASAMGTGDGPLSVTFPNWAYAFSSWGAEALAQMGIPPLDEGFQNGRLLGQAWPMFAIDPETMTRESAQTAFARLDLPDFYFYPLTMGTKILFDDSRKATGVTVQTAGAEYTLSARNEVIVSGGFISSPQLLQVSGIGDAELLRSLDIPVVSDLPGVGRNLQDHVSFPVTYGVNAITTSHLGDPEFLAEQVRLFREEASGMLTSPGFDVIGFEKIPAHIRNSTFSARTSEMLDAEFPADWPELEYLVVSGYLGDNVFSSGVDPLDGTAYGSLDIVLGTGLSRGSITITSADGAVPPAIDPAFMTDRVDVEVMIAGYKRAREFWTSSALEGFVVGAEVYPGLAANASDADIEAVLRSGFSTIWHGASTCAMGRPDDPNAVVDTRARVYGVQGLRVVDASAFPFLPPGAPQATIYALAEKIACDISGNCPEL